MKNKSQYETIQNYRINIPQRHIQHKFLNYNSKDDNLSFDKQNVITNKNKYSPYKTIEQTTIKSKNLNNFNNNFSQGKYFNKENKGYFYRNFYNIPNNRTEDFKVMEENNYYNINSMNKKPFGLFIQAKENDNNKENNYPSNYSYYEYKYIKKKKNMPISTINISNNNFFQANTNYSILSSSENKRNSLNNNYLNISHQTITNGDNKSKNFNSLYSKKSDDKIYYQKIQKDKIKLENNNNKKRTIILNNYYKISNLKPFDQNKNNTYIRTIPQPRTPLIIPNHQLPSPINNKNDNNFRKNKDKLVLNKILSSINPIRKEYSSKQNFDVSKGKVNNITESFIPNIRKPPLTPKQVLKFKSFVKITNNLLDEKDNNNKYNNNSTIINDRKIHKNIIIIKNNNNDNKLSQKLEKLNSGLLPKNKSNNLNFQNNNNTIVKNIIYENRNNEIKNKNYLKNKNKKISNISIRNPNNYKDEYDYLNKIHNITYEPSTEPVNKIKYIKEIKKYEINNIKNKSRNIYVKNKDSSKEKNDQQNEIFKRQIYLSSTDIRNNSNTKDINANNNKRNKNCLNSNSNIFEHNIKSKSEDIGFGNIINKQNKTINNNKNYKKIQAINYINKEKIEDKINPDNKTKKTKLNISKTQSSKDWKNTIPHNYSNLSKNNIDDTINNSKQKFQGNLLELPRHVSRLDELQKKEKKMKGRKLDEWDKLQFKGMRKKTYDIRRQVKKNKQKNDLLNTSIDAQFSSLVYVKASEGFSLAGRNEQKNRKKNQDTYIIEKNVNGILNFNIFGVLDGHGDDGHLVSQFVKRYIIHRIKNHPLIKKLDEPKEIYTQLKSRGFDILSKIFIDADAQIQKEKFDSTRSGTTIVLVIQLEEKIICANTGDSRAIAIYDERNDDNLANSKIFHLSYDCKPNLPNEKRRIYEAGGVVEKAYYSDAEDDDEHIPFRVWAKDGDYPGLAMSRSIGDMDAKKVGVIPDPQFVEYTIDNHSKYLLICSDGIWEFMSNEQAMKISNKFYLRNDPKGLCHELSQEAIKLWEVREVVIDDITIVVVFF